MTSNVSYYVNIILNDASVVCKSIMGKKNYTDQKVAHATARLFATVLMTAAIAGAISSFTPTLSIGLLALSIGTFVLSHDLFKFSLNYENKIIRGVAEAVNDVSHAVGKWLGTQEHERLGKDLPKHILFHGTILKPVWIQLSNLIEANAS